MYLFQLLPLSLHVLPTLQDYTRLLTLVSLALESFESV